MADPRIPIYREAVLAMAQGVFQVRVPADDRDDVGRLGEAILTLSESLNRKFRELRQLAQIAERVNTGVILDEVLNHVYDAFRGVLPYDRIGFSLLEDEGRMVRAIWARTDSAVIELPKGYVAPMEGSSLQGIVESGQPRVLNDLTAYLREHPKSESTRRVVAEGVRSSLTCPLIAMGKPVGFMFFSSCTPGIYAQVHVDLFCQIAGQLAHIVEKARLYGELLETQRQLAAANRVLERLASMDGLTGLPNRRYFDATLDREWRRLQRVGRPLALIAMDIDHFKAYNDTYGHAKGDDCLKALSAAIRDSLQRGGDFVARCGGEEFVAVLADTDAEGGRRTAERLCEHVAALRIPHRGHEGADWVTVSAGVAATVPDSRTNAEALMQAADRALYAAKHAGRNRVALGSIPDVDPAA